MSLSDTKMDRRRFLKNASLAAGGLITAITPMALDAHVDWARQCRPDASAPSGAILFCEDDASGDSDGHPLAPGLTDVNRIVGLGRSGEPFEFCVNVFSDSEFADACFSPDGEILFVNIQGGADAGSGMTCAIWDPWRRGSI